MAVGVAPRPAAPTGAGGSNSNATTLTTVGSGGGGLDISEKTKEHPQPARKSAEEAPRSRGLPLTTKHTPQLQPHEVKLVHPYVFLSLASFFTRDPFLLGTRGFVSPKIAPPLTFPLCYSPINRESGSYDTSPPRILLHVPLQIRFITNGLISNILFMVVYNMAVYQFHHKVSASAIYTIVYFIFIPLGHLMVSLLVFGWPERYVPSLMSNFPIGLTALAIGGALTAYLDKIQFNTRVEEYVRDNWTFSKMPERPRSPDDEDYEEEQGEFYTSLLVLVVTSVWTYVLSVYINAPPAKSEKKEL